ncbi:MAG TPA: hypothetical protein VGM92_09860 [Candidatus Kapabacteria bacterium]|jgi:hypothetical protein
MRVFRYFGFALLAAMLYGCATGADLSYPAKDPLEAQVAAAGCAGFFEARCENIKDGVDQWHEHLSASATVFQNPEAIITLGNDTIREHASGTKKNPAAWEQFQIWNVNVPSFGPFTDTVIAPSPFTIIAPTELMHHDSITKKTGFTITYTDPQCDSIWIYLRTNVPLSHLLDKTIPSDVPAVTYLSARVAGTGSFHIPPSALAAFPSKGVLNVQVIAQHSKYAERNGKWYLFRSTSIASVNSFLAP